MRKKIDCIEEELTEKQYNEALEVFSNNKRTRGVFNTGTNEVIDTPFKEYGISIQHRLSIDENGEVVYNECVVELHNNKNATVYWTSSKIPKDIKHIEKTVLTKLSKILDK